MLGAKIVLYYKVSIHHLIRDCQWQRMDWKVLKNQKSLDVSDWILSASPKTAISRDPGSPSENDSGT